MVNKTKQLDQYYKEHAKLDTLSMLASMYMLVGIPIFYLLNFVALGSHNDAYFMNGLCIALATSSSGLVAILGIEAKSQNTLKKIESLSQNIKIEQEGIMLLVLVMELKDRYSFQVKRELTSFEVYNLLQSMPSSLDIDLLSKPLEIKGH